MVLQVIRNGARIADIGGAAGVEALEENVPEYEVALHATRAMVREIADTYPRSDIMDSKCRILDSWHHRFNDRSILPIISCLDSEGLKR